MKIVILDAVTLGNDIDLSNLSKHGDLTLYDTTTLDQTEERIKNAEIIITNKVIIGKKELDAAKNLKLVCVAATGYNNIDILEANKRNIIVTNVKGYSTESVAQQVFAYILAFYNSTFEYNSTIKANKWQQSPTFTLLSHEIIELSGKTLGIIGYGAIGQRVGQIAGAFGMNILTAKIPGRKYENSNHKDMDFVLSNSDIITIHAPLNEKTENLISKKELKLMKKSAILVNYARGGIVNEQDLFEALKTQKIKGAIVDVLTNEPPTQNNILFGAPNIFITPHVAWTSKEARQRLVNGISENIENFINGKASKIRILN
ncbi:MAG: D-2-hydroxyacid dehydrogenase [Bacteroidales bacterium]|nr:D-2-hydroxyacid dehydrogenase [Bacteroidales bacterium]